MRKGHIKIDHKLLENGADANGNRENQRTALKLAAQGGFSEIVRQLLEKGADINMVGYNGSAPRVASEGGHDETVKLLLGKGADFDSVGWHRATL